MSEMPTLEELLAAGEVEYVVLFPDGTTVEEANRIRAVCEVAYKAGKASATPPSKDKA